MHTLYNIRTRHLPLITLSLLPLSTFLSCSKLSDNGDLDGRWRLQEIYTKLQPSDTHYSATPYTDKRPSQIYWNFQQKLLWITSVENLNHFTDATTARFIFSGNTLSLTHTYIHYRDRDSLLTDPSTSNLDSLGIRSNQCKYEIKKLTSTRLILCSEQDSLVFYQLK